MVGNLGILNRVFSFFIMCLSRSAINEHTMDELTISLYGNLVFINFG